MVRQIKPIAIPELRALPEPDKLDTLPVVASESEHSFYLNTKYTRVRAQLPAVEMGKSYGLFSFGQWDLRYLVFHIARLIGPCEVISTTYGLGPRAAQGIVQGLQKGIFTSFAFLYDRKVREYKEEAHFICSSNFKVKLTSIHAKLTVLRNEHFSVLITGSANWSDSNSKIEYTEIICDHAKAAAVWQVLSRAIEAEASNPLEILKELGYEL